MQSPANRLGEYPRPRRFFNQVDNGRLYNALVMVAYLTRVIEGNGQWAAHLLALMDGYPRIPQERMGFLSNWKRFDIWQS